MRNTKPTRMEADIVRRAWMHGTAIPSFNIPYLPMMEPVARALRDTRTAGMIAVARLEWIKFESRSLRAVRDAYEETKDEPCTWLHLDHVPVIDEDNLRVDYEPIMREAIALGYRSVMIDGSRLPLDANIAAAKSVADMAHAAGRLAEAELGAVMGHEEGPLPPYEELFASGKGFTDPDEARRFVRETGVDWLSVAVGSVHGAVSQARKSEKKVEARLNLDHLSILREAAGVPIVLHGGSGIRRDYILEGIRRGIAKINIGTAIRQPYEQAVHASPEAARQAVYEAAVRVICEEMEVAGTVRRIFDSGTANG